VCSKCKVDKPSSEYSTRIKKTTRKSGEVYEVMCLMSACKECRRLASLTANMKKEHLERKRERDRIRAKSEENKHKRNEATKRYRQSDKGKQYNVYRHYQERGNLYCELIHVDCCVCGNKEVKRVKPTMGRGYKERCSNCSIAGTYGLKLPERTIKEVACKSCGLMYMGKSTNSMCVDCVKIAKRNAKRNDPHHNHRKRARLYKCKYEPVNKKRVFERDNYKCYLCGTDVVISKIYREDQATIDHVIPMSKGGAHTYDNVKTCCNKCNWTKGSKPGTIEGMAM